MPMTLRSNYKQINVVLRHKLQKNIGYIALAQYRFRFQSGPRRWRCQCQIHHDRIVAPIAITGNPFDESARARHIIALFGDVGGMGLGD